MRSDHAERLPAGVAAAPGGDAFRRTIRQETVEAVGENARGEHRDRIGDRAGDADESGLGG